MSAEKTSKPTLAGRLKALRSSAGYGRLRARAPRYAFLAFVIVMCAAGMRSILIPAGQAAPAAPERAPLDYAEQSFALGFARAYLSYDNARPGRREAALATYASSGFDLEAGFTPPPSGSQRVRWVDVAQVQRPLAGGVAITVAAKLSTGPDPVYLSVPVDRKPSHAIYLAGYPSFVGPPLTSSRRPAEQGGESVDDEEVEGLIRRALANYLSGDAEDLSADLADAATVTLPTNALRLQSLQRLVWVKGRGGGAVLATIDAGDGRGGSYALRYEVGVRRVTSADPRLGPGWRVTYIQAISQES